MNEQRLVVTELIHTDGWTLAARHASLLRTC
jgi:hypothetical protein